MNTQKIYQPLWFIIALFLIIGCNDSNNDSEKQLDPGVVSSIEQSVKVQNIVNTVVTQVNTVAFGNVSFVKNSFIEFDCPKIDVGFDDETFDLDSIVLDYGEEFCDTPDGRKYKGKIIILFDTIQFSEIGIFFENFCSEEFCMDGEFSYDFHEENDANFYLQIQNGNFEDTEGNNYNLSVDFSYEQIAGAETEELTDDIYQISGTSSGTTPEGDNFTITITTPLIFSFECNWITSGVAEFEMTNIPKANINYGDGTCDDKAIITIDNVEKEITM